MKTVTGLFDTYADAQSAVTALEEAGIPTDDISLVSNRADGETEDGTVTGAQAGAGLGALVGGVGGLLTGLGLMAIPGVGPVVAAGWLAATATGAVAGAMAGGAAGGLIGALTSSGVSEEDAHVYAEGVRRGGTVVAVKVDNDVSANRARAILDRSNVVNPSERRQSYKQDGWMGFDEKSEPYATDQITRERERERDRIRTRTPVM
ncbi:MAG: general stress protein [Elstera sp.]